MKGMMQGAVAVSPKGLLSKDESPVIIDTYKQSKIIRTVVLQKQFWSVLYHKHYSELICYLQGKWQKEPDDASDIVHQAFERFMLIPKPLSIKQPRAYLFQLVRNLVLDGFKYEKVRVKNAWREETQGEPATSDIPLQSVLDRERLNALAQLVEKMPAKRRQAFILNRVYQVSYHDIAKEMGISIGGVKKHVLRALETCQAHMEHRFEE